MPNCVPGTTYVNLKFILSGVSISFLFYRWKKWGSKTWVCPSSHRYCVRIRIQIHIVYPTPVFLTEIHSCLISSLLFAFSFLPEKVSFFIFVKVLSGFCLEHLHWRSCLDWWVIRTVNTTGTGINSLTTGCQCKGGNAGWTTAEIGFKKVTFVKQITSMMCHSLSSNYSYACQV